MKKRHPDYRWWAMCEIMAPFFGWMAASQMLRGASFLAMFSYLLGTFWSLGAGSLLKRVGKTADDVVRLNNLFHKWSVLLLNGLVGMGCAVYLRRHPMEAMLPAWILGGFFLLYILSWALRIIRPHSLLARFRSVLLRAALTTVIVGIMWKHGYWLVPLVSIPVLISSWRHLRRDQARFNWADR